MRCGYILLINDIENVVTESKNDNVATLLEVESVATTS